MGALRLFSSKGLRGGIPLLALLVFCGLGESPAAAEKISKAGTVADLSPLLSGLPQWPQAPSDQKKQEVVTSDAPSCSSAEDFVPPDFIEKLTQLNSPALKGALPAPLGTSPLSQEGRSSLDVSPSRRVMGPSSSKPVVRTARPSDASSGYKAGVSVENGVKVFRGPPR